MKSISLTILLQIWKQPFYAHANAHTSFSSGLQFLFAALCSQVAAWIFYGIRKEYLGVGSFMAGLILCVGSFVILFSFLWFAHLTSNLRKQYSATNARLVPNFKQNLKLAVIVPIVVLLILASLGYFFVYQKLSISVVFFFLCVLLIILALVKSDRAWFLTAIPFSLHALSDKIVGSVFYQSVENAVPFAMLATISFILCLILTMLTLNYIFSTNDRSIFGILRIGGKNDVSSNGQVLVSGFFSSVLTLPFHLWMNYSIANTWKVLRKHRDRSYLAAFCFGPRFHWLTVFMQMGSFILLVICTRLLFEFMSGSISSEFIKGFFIGLLIPLTLFSPLFYFGVFFHGIYRTRMEQGLVGLTPSAGTGLEFDVQLRRYSLRQFLISYALVYVLVLSISVVFDRENKSSLAIAFISCQFPLVLLILKDHASMKAETDRHLKSSVFLFGLVFAVFYFPILILDAKYVWLGLPITIIATCLILRQQHKLKRGGLCFPVGRAA